MMKHKAKYSVDEVMSIPQYKWQTLVLSASFHSFINVQTNVGTNCCILQQKTNDLFEENRAYMWIH